MASLTPGVLSKLLQHAANKDFKVTGEHRSALLQVIEIVPSLAAADDHDPWRSRGFFLKLSDSLHSAYVSISDDDIDLIYSDKIQLGQFVYVTRLDSGSPVPVLRGLKPVPKRRPCPCVGNPTDLVPSDLLPIRPTLDLDFTKPVNAKANKAKAKANTNIPNAAIAAKKLQVEGLELRRLSLDSARKVWDQSPTPRRNGANSTTASRSKSKQISTSSDSASVISDKKASSKNDSPIKRSSLSISPLKNKNDIFSPKSLSKTLNKDLKPMPERTIPNHLIKVPLNFRTRSNQKILWDTLPSTIHDLGKQAVSHRNVAFLAAARALEEASAAEGVIHCMRTFAEFCESSKKFSAGPLVEQFLDLHQSMQRAGKVVNSLMNAMLPEPKSSSVCSLQSSMPEVCKIFNNKNATSWVQAAVETNLSKFNLFRMQDKSKLLIGEKHHYVIIENTPEELNSENNSPQDKQSHRNHGSSLSDTRAKRVPSPSPRHLSATKKTNTVREEWSKGSRLKDAASLAEKLLLVSHEWFFKYLEDSLNVGFALSSDQEGRSEIAHLLRQLKRVNQWLDDLVGGGAEVDERIENLRKKLYGFLLEHVDSTILTSK